SPDGTFLVVVRDGERSGDFDLYLVELASGDVEHITPHEGEAFYSEPVWRPDGAAFYCATDNGRDMRAIARYDVATRGWQFVLDSQWDLDCHGDESGRWLLVEANQDGYTRLTLHDAATLDAVEEVELPDGGVVEDIVFGRDGSCFAFRFSSPVDPGDVWAFD